MPLSAAASSLADNPSTMKLLERLRWLETDSVTPGTAEVSGKSCVLATLVGETPGTSSATSRKLRPLSGRFWSSACDTVPAIWLRAPSSRASFARTSTAVCEASRPSSSTTGTSNAAPTVSVSRRVAVPKPGLLTVRS